MTATKAATGYGSAFAIGDGNTPETFTPIAELTSIKGLKVKRDQMESTTLMAAGQFKQYAGGLRDFDAVGGVLNYFPGGADEAALKTAYAVQRARNYRIILPNGGAWTFPGIMTEFTPGDLDPNKKMEANFTIKPASALAAAIAVPMLAYSNPLNLAFGMAALIL